MYVKPCYSLPPVGTGTSCLITLIFGVPCLSAALLVEWQAATKARQSLGADAKTSSDESGASAETDTSRAHQVPQSLHSCRPKHCDEHSWVCFTSDCGLHLVRVVSAPDMHLEGS